MKLTKKKILALAVIVSLVAVISMGSLAWFSAQDVVENKFMVANSDDDTADEVFSLDVYEYVDGTATPVNGNTYEDILPGDKLKKDVHVQNTGYYDQYIRVTVTITDATAWATALGTGFNDETLEACFVGWDKTKWNHVTSNYDATNDVITVVMYYKDILQGDHTGSAGQSISVFTDVQIPTTMTQEGAALFNADATAGFGIDVKAEAVQTENVVPDGIDAADAGYYACQTVYPPVAP